MNNNISTTFNIHSLFQRGFEATLTLKSQNAQNTSFLAQAEQHFGDQPVVSVENTNELTS